MCVAKHEYFGISVIEPLRCSSRRPRIDDRQTPDTLQRVLMSKQTALFCLTTAATANDAITIPAYTSLG